MNAMIAEPVVEISADVPPVPIWRLTVAQYHQMIQAGILTDDDPIELLEGWLVVKMSKNRPHSLSTRVTREWLERVVPAAWYVDTQEPITAATSEPEPDIMVVKGTPRDYTTRHPYPEEVALVVEVADSSLERDRTLKARIYARAGIPLYWLLNLTERQLEVYSQPNAEGYQNLAIYREDDLAPLTLGETQAQTPVRGLLP